MKNKRRLTPKENILLINLGQKPLWLRAANLAETDLSGADLRQADLFDACLKNANLEGANLAGVNWTEQTYFNALCFDEIVTD